MLKIKNLYTCISMLCMTITAFSQTATVKGTITTSNGNSAEFVNVVLENTQKGAITNIDGNYVIKGVSEGEYTITASYLSSKTQKKSVVVKKDETLIVDFVMEERDFQLDEVVISAGRTSEKLSEVPASITVVDAKKLQNLSLSTSNISDILEYAVPGLAPSTGTFSSWGQTLRGRLALVRMVDGIPQSTAVFFTCMDAS